MRSLSVFVLVAAAPASALAAVPIELRLSSDLPGIKRETVEHIIELELRHVHDAGAGSPTVVDVASLPGSTRVRITIDDAVTGKSVARTVDLAAMGPNGGNRLLGIAIVELLAASWAEIKANPKPEAPPAEPVASPEVRKEAQAAIEERHPVYTQLSAIAVGSGPYHQAGALFGGGIRVVPALAPHVALPLDARFEHGRRENALGSVGIDALTLGAGLAWQSAGDTFVRFGGGARGGFARFSGRPKDDALVSGSAVWTPWGGPTLSASLGRAWTSLLLTELIFDGGYAFAPTRAGIDRAPDVGIDGFWVSVGVAVGVRLLQ